MKKRSMIFSLVALSVFIVLVVLGITTAGDEVNEKSDYLPTQDFVSMSDDPSSYWDNYGRVHRIFITTSGRTEFTLEGGKTAMDPLWGHYYIPTGHDNYEAMIDLLYTAADNHWVMYVGTKSELDERRFAEVTTFLVDF